MAKNKLPLSWHWRSGTSFCLSCILLYPCAGEDSIGLRLIWESLWRSTSLRAVECEGELVQRFMVLRCKKVGERDTRIGEEVGELSSC